ncbi:MAG: NAD(P)H-hydrate dehydratase [Hylemonella sp.]
MFKIAPGPSWLLHGSTQTKSLEANSRNLLPANTLMQRAGLASARLTLALAPHAQTIWIACGPGNNGGDGLEAACHLHQWGKTVHLSWLGSPESAPEDTLAAYQRVTSAGLSMHRGTPPECDFCVDALLGIGASRPAEGVLLEWIHQINGLDVPVLSVDLPSGLDGDTGFAHGVHVRATHTLSLLTLKPGLFTSLGRDASGQVWFDTLGIPATTVPAAAQLNGKPAPTQRPHASHKGSYGDLAVIGGAPGMTGAAILAANAALHHGAGRVFVCLLADDAPLCLAAYPELMLRPAKTFDASAMTLVCGCGGADVISDYLPRALSNAPRLVLDADALNAIARDTQLQHLLRARSSRKRQTVLTPHPLEAARLCKTTVAEVQSNRLGAADELAAAFGCTVVLKGSGTVIAAPGQTSRINPTGNARLATAGTGDVLAGMIGARLAQGEEAFKAACAAVWLHGQAADSWPEGLTLSAGALASQQS